MQATSYYLVIIELLLAVCGGIYFLYRASLQRHLLYGADFFIALLTFITPFCFLLDDADSRWLGLKTALFVCCLHLSSKYPRPSMLLLATLAFIGFILDYVVTGEFLSKHVGFNGNELLPIPFTLIICAFLLSRRDSHINLAHILVVVSIDVFCAFILDARAASISALLVTILVLSPKSARIFLKYGQWIPFIYLSIVLISYYSMLSKYDFIPVTPSNIERSSMIFAAVSHFFDYPFMGPRGEFDQMAGAITKIFNWQLYKDTGGVDPHFFFLSLWRDNGAILTLLWVIPWFYYWHVLNKMNIRFDETRMRVVFGLLAISTVQFCTTPPSTGKRLLVALIMGAVMGFAKQRLLVNSKSVPDQLIFSTQNGNTSKA